MSCDGVCPEESACVAQCMLSAPEEEAAAGVTVQQLGAVFLLLCMSGLFSGLTLGLMSLDPQQLRILIAGGTPIEKRQAERILPIRLRGNQLLCTLLLGNTVVNAGIAILTASFTSGLLGGLLSTAFILIFGEIVPQSVCSRYGLAIGARTTEIVMFFMALLYVAAKPISLVLDKLLGEELGTLYNKKELKQLFAMQVADGTSTRGSACNDANRETVKSDELKFITGALALSEKNLSQIMTAMDDVFGLYPDELLDFELMRRIYESGYTRIPVFQRPVDRHTGRPLYSAIDPSRRIGITRNRSRNVSNPDDDASSDTTPSKYGGTVALPLQVLGLLSTKDLILVDPEDAMPVEQLLAHCGRDLLTVWFDTPVNTMLTDFLVGNSHLAFVQRVNTEDPSTDPFYELIGIVTLEDVLEELIQSEIVDETDAYEDNVSKKPVIDSRLDEGMRRMAWTNMLDPDQLENTELSDVEEASLASFLAANVDAFQARHISNRTLQELLSVSTVQIAYPDDEQTSCPFTANAPCDRMIVVLQGRLHVVCGSEGFESDRGPWTVLGAAALRQPNYRTDFTARVMEPSRLLQIRKCDYEDALAREASAPPPSPQESPLATPIKDSSRGPERTEVVLRLPGTAAASEPGPSQAGLMSVFELEPAQAQDERV